MFFNVSLYFSLIPSHTQQIINKIQKNTKTNEVIYVTMYTNYKNAINQVFIISTTTKQLYIVYTKISYHQMCSVKLKTHQNPFSAGAPK